MKRRSYVSAYAAIRPVGRMTFQEEKENVR